MFLVITYDVRWGGTKSLNEKLVHSVSRICDCIQDDEWQQLTNNTLRKNSENQIVLAIVVRLFNAEIITNNNMKSYYRYDRKKNRLNIDIILGLEKYIHLPEIEIVECISKDIYEYLSIVLKKYSSRLVDFNVPIFLLALKEKFEEIIYN